jgi:hypothetical protein
MSVREEFYFGILFVASVWAVMSAVVVAASVRMEDKIFALFFAASFALSALIGVLLLAVTGRCGMTPTTPTWQRRRNQKEGER